MDDRRFRRIAVVAVFGATLLALAPALRTAHADTYDDMVSVRALIGGGVLFEWYATDTEGLVLGGEVTYEHRFPGVVGLAAEGSWLHLFDREETNEDGYLRSYDFDLFDVRPTLRVHVTKRGDPDVAFGFGIGPAVATDASGCVVAGLSGQLGFDVRIPISDRGQFAAGGGLRLSVPFVADSRECNGTGIGGFTFATAGIAFGL